MTTTSAERNRASRLRGKLRQGRVLAPAERSWFDEYMARVGKARVEPDDAAEREPAPRPVAPESADRAAEPAVAIPDAQATTTTIRTWGASLAPPSPQEPVAVPSPKCDVPDCPACRGAVGGRVCSVTGRRVWPKMSDAGARAQANVVLGLVRMGVTLTVGESPDKPTKEQIGKMADAIQEISYRRASWLGAFDDLFMAAEALGDYGVHSIADATRKKKARARAALPIPKTQVVAPIETTSEAAE